MYVFDATPLISLASVDRLELVSVLDGDCAVPAPVYEEVVTTGITAGYADARRIEQAIEAGQFSIEPVPETPLVEKLSRSDTLSGADIAVLTLAADCDGVAVMDEQAGRTVAGVEGIQTRGTAYIVLNAQSARAINATTARQIIDELLDSGWYCAPDLYRQIRAKIDDIEAECDS